VSARLPKLSPVLTAAPLKSSKMLERSDLLQRLVGSIPGVIPEERHEATVKEEGEACHAKR